MVGKKKKKKKKKSNKLNIKKRKLTPQQELFCQIYIRDREFFGNGVQSYIEAYNINLSKPGQYNVAKAGAYENLTKPYLLERMNKLLKVVINDTIVDKELAFTIVQKGNLAAKVAAIKEYNALKGRVIQKREHSFDSESLNTIEKIMRGLAKK